ncbi:DNA polymerase alpha subunit B [Bradysia coprophila]|uniref:DNA polymerase alpha subunit B n=1 Tax=Bradysia coprophila TaxID=38358 RepID=UPI00187DB385|nr:DNA polymerase alpha subunit B [Bradysia coprophila]
MISTETIAEQFDELGLEPSTAILERCVHLCNEYNITAADFNSIWVAFSLTHLNGADPTLDNLNELERKEFANAKNVNNSKNKTTSQQPDNNSSCYDDLPDDDIMDSYGFHTPKAPKPQSRLHRAAVENSITASPATYSPVSGLTKAHSDTSGKVIYTYGNSTLLKNTDWGKHCKQDVEIIQLSNNDADTLLATNENYMFDPLLEKCLISRDSLYGIAKDVYMKHFKNDTLRQSTNDNEADIEPFSDLSNPNVPGPEQIKCVGRICCDNEGKLDASSTVLIGTDDSKMRSVNLNFSRLKSFAVIPGQTVMVKGVNPRGDVLYVNEILTENTLNSPKHIQLAEPLSMVIASGPFTKTTDITYEPMHELIQYCQTNKPNVLIINGPFLDADNQIVATGELSESFASFFEKMIVGLVDAIGEDTHIAVVSSSRDAHSTMVYPTHPNKLIRTYNNLSMLPDPCTISINGFTIGIISTDVIGHISDAELAVGVADKIKRCVNYMFHQKSFYPLNPPSLDLFVDSELAAKHGQLNHVPNMLVVPSDTKQFIRDINNCLVLNPGRVAPMSDGGTFARVVVTQSEIETPLMNYVACQIIRV